MSTQSPPKRPVPEESRSVRLLRRRTRSPVPTERESVPDDPDGRINERRRLTETVGYNEQFTASKKQQMGLFQTMQESMMRANLATATVQRTLDATEDQLKTTCKQFVDTERKLRLTDESYIYYRDIYYEKKRFEEETREASIGE